MISADEKYSFRRAVDEEQVNLGVLSMVAELQTDESDKLTIEQLNQEYVDAFMNADVEWYREHLADDFVCIESDGSALHKQQFYKVREKAHMQKSRSACLIPLIVLLVITATSARSHKPADIRGVITQINQSEGENGILGRILIEGTKESDTQVDKANVTMTTRTKVFNEQDGERKPAAFTDLKKGQRVEALFTGPVMESYPVQATADEVTILSSAQPTGSAQIQPDNEIVARLKQATQELLDAIAPGNKSVWQRYYNWI